MDKPFRLLLSCIYKIPNLKNQMNLTDPPPTIVIQVERELDWEKNHK
jgi:hypothetical protein